jgi:hypothetical protein
MCPPGNERYLRDLSNRSPQLVRSIRSNIYALRSILYRLPIGAVDGPRSRRHANVMKLFNSRQTSRFGECATLERSYTPRRLPDFMASARSTCDRGASKEAARRKLRIGDLSRCAPAHVFGPGGALHGTEQSPITVTRAAIRSSVITRVPARPPEHPVPTPCRILVLPRFRRHDNVTRLFNTRRTSGSSGALRTCRRRI